MHPPTASWHAWLASDSQPFRTAAHSAAACVAASGLHAEQRMARRQRPLPRSLIHDAARLGPVPRGRAAPLA
eukprot:6194262-Pleurochrysis_carterae.AAC.3